MALQSQEIFDKVATHLLTQNAKSIDGKACMYRGPNGLRCAVGGIIPDDLMNECNFEGASVRQLFEEPAIEEYFGKENETLLHALQILHDNTNVSEWKTRLQGTADIFGLSSEVLNKF